MDRPSHFLRIKEGITQGVPLAMISYAIGTLPLVHDIYAAHPQVAQLWYMDDVDAGGKLEALCEHMWDILMRGYPRGYFPDPTKGILVIPLQNVQMSEDHFRGMVVRVVTGSIYIGSFTGDQDN